VSEAAYPSHWEADVVLRDGGAAHLRPIRPDDRERLKEFHSRLSEETIYYRFFAPYPVLSERDLTRFTKVDHRDRVALVVLVREELVGVGRYDQVSEGEAEVAFTIRDDFQGRGLGSVLLEHLAAAARENGIHRFVAEVLPANSRMLGVFRDAGYAPRSAMEEGYIGLEFAIEPTATSRAVQESREHRAEARSIERLLAPSSVALIGASRTPGSVGANLLEHLTAGGFTGAAYAVNSGLREGEVLGVLPSYRSVLDIPGEVTLAVVAVPADAVLEVVEECAAKHVRGLVVVSSGFAEAGPHGSALQRALVSRARAGGMRVIGPNCLGIINGDPAVRLNASLSPVMPGHGRIGFFSQSGALGVALLETVVARGLGLSSFVSAGNRADVSGNDLMQFWEDDPNTDVLLLYLESIGNPRKFSRIARRTSRTKPIVAVKSGRSSQGIPLGHTVRGTALPSAAIDALFEQSGVIQVDTLAALFDAAMLLTFQPLPAGPRVGVVGNSDALAVLAADACATQGLITVDPPSTFRADATAQEFGLVLAALVDDPAVDSVLALYLPPVGTTGESVARELAQVAARATKPVLATFLAVEGASTLLRRVSTDGVPVIGSVPTFGSVEDAVNALASITSYATWRATDPGEVPELEGIEPDAARVIVERALGAATEPVALSGSDLTQLLRCYGINVWPSVTVATADEAADAAERLGYPVALKARAPHLAHRADLGGVRLDLANEVALRRAYEAMHKAFGADVASTLTVQRMAGRGVACVIGSTEDALFGPVVSFRLGGAVPELVGDLGFRIPPLTDADAASLVRSPQASALLFGYRGADPTDTAALEDLLLRVGRLCDDLPELARLELNPVLVLADGVAVLTAEATLATPITRRDSVVRRLG